MQYGHLQSLMLMNLIRGFFGKVALAQDHDSTSISLSLAPSSQMIPSNTHHCFRLSIFPHQNIPDLSFLHRTHHFLFGLAFAFGFG